MGVRRFRSVEDMPATSARRPLDPENLVIAFGLMDLAHRIAALSFTPGIKKYRSHDAMLLARERRAATETPASTSRAARSGPAQRTN
jgi:hypothetical protein